MADVILSDGREITFDLNLITMREYRGLFDRKEPKEVSDAKIAKCAGLDPDEFTNMGFVDWHKVSDGFFRAAKEAANNPNSLSASTSE